MDPASAAPVAGSAGIPAAPRTPASSPPSAGRCRTDVPPPAGSSPPHTPRAAPARTVPRLSSLRPLPILAEDLLMPDFCSGATGLSGSFSDGFSLCRSQQTPPKYRSSDNDPLFRFHRWRANLRILEVDEIKTIPCTPVSHPFVERLIGTVRREYLDRTLFWNRGDLERKLDNYKAYYNQHRCHTGLAGATPAERSGVPAQPIARLESYTWRQHCNGLFQTPAAA